MLIQGKQTTNEITPIAVDSLGRILVTDPNPSLFTPTPTSNLFSNLNLPAGNSVQTALTIPASQTWRITTVSITYTGTVAGVTCVWLVYNGTNGLNYNYTPAFVNGVPITLQVNFLMGAGWLLQFIVFGATLNDDFSVSYFSERVY